MDKRDDTRREILLDVCNEPIASIDALVEQCHRALSAQLWKTCCWPDGGLNWKIGDYNYLVVFVEPGEDTSLYMQFWSEPRERVWTEIVSGDRWCPGAFAHPVRRSATHSRRAATRAAGVPGTSRKSSSTRRRTPKRRHSDAADLRGLRVRGQWRLNIERHRGERAEHRPVYTNVTPEDFAKVATRAGVATVTRAATPL
jgi:hypothetical protein